MVMVTVMVMTTLMVMGRADGWCREESGLVVVGRGEGV